MDRSELLACLAADWCSGAVVTRWWWQTLFNRVEVADAVIKVWLEAPEHIPMALQWLEAKHLSVPFMQKLSDDSSYNLIAILVRTFGLHELLPLITEDVTSHSAQTVSTEKERTGTNMVEDASNSSVRVHPPWQRWIQDNSADRLSSHRQLLLGVGLMLQRAPIIVRTASFARQVKDWQFSFDHFRSGERTSKHHISVQPAEDYPSADTVLVDAGSESRSPMWVDQISTMKENVSVNRTDLESSESRMEIIPEFSSTVNDTPPSTTEQRISTAEEHVFQSSMQIKIGEKSVEIAEIETWSQFGGVCYFINLGLYLHLYGDFTTPLQPGLDLPIWDFVALIAEQIIGDEITRDPIWSLLAQLAGRAEDEPTGAHFDPPGHDSLSAWLEVLMLTVRPRLQLALGVGNKELPRFFTQPARIVVTATRLDAYFALADLPIEIRLSGLDRDPGWVPAAGKFISFHYE
ncbi:MAG TPA: hypothetical protein VFR47_22715 [Anaerolineales bacterium]|nr:hypothetical protein [Anaerolineales bacterium]